MLNQITIMGRLTRDPEYRATGSGTLTSGTAAEFVNTKCFLLMIAR